jgi:hypothetical protein
MLRFERVFSYTLACHKNAAMLILLYIFVGRAKKHIVTR